MASSDSEQPQEGANVSVVVTLKDYLKKLEAAETEKAPALRRNVPTIPELAAAAGVQRQTMYNIAGNNIKMVNLETLSAIMSELRRRGFEVEVSDLLKAYPAEAARVPA
jgi:DNA-binding Xre family transcriptional regulator